MLSLRTPSESDWDFGTIASLSAFSGALCGWFCRMDSIFGKFWQRADLKYLAHIRIPEQVP
jgi:hypothetical protein